MSTHKLIAIILACAASLTGAAQPVADTSTGRGLTALKCFKEAPADVLGMLEPNTRLDMIDYYEAGIERPSQNTAGGECRITAIDDYSISFVGGTGTDYQLFVLDPKSESPTIGVIVTLQTPIPDSAITLYHTNWDSQAVRDTKAFNSSPTLSDWMRPGYTKHRAEIEEAIPFIMADYSYDPSTSTLTITNNMAQYFTANDTPKALSMLKDSVSYRWNPKARAFYLIK